MRTMIQRHENIYDPGAANYRRLTKRLNRMRRWSRVKAALRFWR